MGILLLDRVVSTKRFKFKNKFLVRRKKNAIQEIGRLRGCFQGRGQCQQQRLPVAIPLCQQKAVPRAVQARAVLGAVQERAVLGAAEEKAAERADLRPESRPTPSALIKSMLTT